MALFKSKEEKLKVAIWELKDAVYHYDKWAFGLSPSERRRELQNIARRARKVDSLGADGDYYLTYKIRDAMDEYLG